MIKRVKGACPFPNSRIAQNVPKNKKELEVVK